jgi:hypothetical protein
MKTDEKDYLDKLRRAADAELVKAEFEKRTEEVLSLLDRLGVTNNGDIYSQEVIKDPLLYLCQITDDMMTNDLNTLLVYALLQENCSGVSTVEAISGRAKFSVVLDGVDIFSLLPPAPPIVSLVAKVEAMRANKGLQSRLRK